MPKNPKSKISEKNGLLRRLGLFISQNRKRRASRKKVTNLTELITTHAMRLRSRVRKKNRGFGLFEKKDIKQKQPSTSSKIKKPGK